MTVDLSHLPTCAGCNRPVRPQRSKPIPGTVRYGGKNQCAGCYMAEYRAEAKAAETRRREARERQARDTTTIEAPQLQLVDLIPDPDSDWRDQALCAQTDPTVFFPERNDNANVAKKICQQCPVRTQCLQFAIDNDEHYGVWGGLSAKQRKKLRRRKDTAA